jgi:non-specific serine/threonine protein kinase
VDDPALVPQALATALGIQEEPNRPLTQTLTTALRERWRLLLLDNCEHLVDAAARLAETLLLSCPSLRILATSREPLGVAGERVYRVPALDLPIQDEAADLSRLSRCSAVQLFVERAAAVDPGFMLTEDSAATVVEICRRLDGIPLAIELAAARVKVLSVDQIASRLSDAFRLLTGGIRTALPRQQTLRATVDWSYALLSEQERALVRRLAVFAGGWSLESAEAIGAGEGIAEDEVLDLLAQLVNKSLVVVEQAGGSARYRLLETIRQYGREQLMALGELAAVRDRHLQYFTGLAERGELLLQGPEQKVWLELLEAELDDLRAALQWSLESGNVVFGLRLAGSLYWFSWMRGYQLELQHWLEQALAARPEAPTSVRVKALTAAGLLAMFTDGARATAQLKEGLALARELNEPPAVARVLTWLGAAKIIQGRYAEARGYLAQAESILRPAGDRWWLARTLWYQGNLSRSEGDFVRARRLQVEALAVRRQMGDTAGIAFSLMALAQVAAVQQHDAEAETFDLESVALFRELGGRQGEAMVLIQMGERARGRGEFERATAWYDEALTVHRRTGMTEGVTVALINLGQVTLRQGNIAQAAAHFVECLRGAQDLGSREKVDFALLGFAGIAAALKQPERAARLFGAASELTDALHARGTQADRNEYERILALVRTQIDEAAFAAASEAGQALTQEEAVAEAFDLAAEVVPEGSAGPRGVQ